MNTTNHPMRALREQLNLSIKHVAKETKLSFRTIWRAEQWHSLNPDSRQQLCLFFGKSSEELGLTPRRAPTLQQYAEDDKKQKADQGQQVETAAQDMLNASDRLENEGIDMKHSRRSFFYLFATAGVALSLAPREVQAEIFAAPDEDLPDISASALENLSIITQRCRTLQRSGLSCEESLKGHIVLIQKALEQTTHEGHRRELWRLLAQSQLLARHSISRKQMMGRARTWNEAAVGAAQYSGDALLMAAALGHLAHLYLTNSDQLGLARQLLDQAQEYAGKHTIGGWFAMIAATMAAKVGRVDECETSILRATEQAHSLPSTAEYTDLYYTDFNVTGTDAFAGNCLLKINRPKQALARLTTMSLDTLSANRHASAFYDTACAYRQLGDLEAMQSYAFSATDKAVATNRHYLIPRLIRLGREIQEKDPKEAHAATIIEYAYAVLPDKGDAA
jgi:hypothetical protein